MRSMYLAMAIAFGAQATDATYATYPDWLATDKCKVTDVPLLPKGMTQLEYYPLDAYNKNMCEDLKPISSSSSDYQAKIDYLTNRYNLFSWLQFIALNREVNNHYEITQKNLGRCDKDANCGNPVWLNWRETDTIFLEQGVTPVDWQFNNNASLIEPLRLVEQVAPPHMPYKDAILIDQSNNPVYYQKFVSPYLFEFIKKKSFYNLDGQIDYANKRAWACKNDNDIDNDACITVNTIGFLACKDPSQTQCDKIQDLTQFDWSSTTPGMAIEIKVAWKVLEPDDDKSKYITRLLPVREYEDFVSGQSSPYTVTNKYMGVVGFHIIQKTGSSKNWVYSTFSHKSNIDGLSPSFYDRNCPTCPVNNADNGQSKTQVTRIDAISPITRQVNEHVVEALTAENSVLQFYQLIGTQFTTDRSEPLTDNTGKVSTSKQVELENYSGNHPYPVYLTNEVLETFLQIGNEQVEGQKKPIYNSSSCMNCHAKGGIAVKCDTSLKKAVFGLRTSDFMFIFDDAHWKNQDKYCAPQNTKN
ncbi:hypothetical protein L1077_25150 [Pseudoalteromonas luteoviolacea]|uniref:hypothetical protein n=1 Tax=Pseudoalteromonas luteoviolacea TaxID=43657 RepID=UPI001F47B605|nr:hypothetical protein [Pseudoalteromonas luteoviolacea]MCF6442715.1 hypothetical protein [Pseudoalteromonas luteoviolacea]